MGDVVICRLDSNWDMVGMILLMKGSDAKKIKEAEGDIDEISEYLFAEEIYDGDAGVGFFGFVHQKLGGSRLVLNFLDGSYHETFRLVGDLNIYKVYLSRSSPLINLSSFLDIEADGVRAGREANFVYIRTIDDLIKDVVIYSFINSADMDVD